MLLLESSKTVKQWPLMKWLYPTRRQLKFFRYTHKPLGQCVYQENTSVSWDISWYTTRNRQTVLDLHVPVIRLTVLAERLLRRLPKMFHFPKLAERVEFLWEYVLDFSKLFGFSQRLSKVTEDVLWTELIGFPNIDFLILRWSICQLSRISKTFYACFDSVRFAEEVGWVLFPSATRLKMSSTTDHVTKRNGDFEDENGRMTQRHIFLGDRLPKVCPTFSEGHKKIGRLNNEWYRELVPVFHFQFYSAFRHSSDQRIQTSTTTLRLCLE